MNLASILLKNILILKDIETWSDCPKHYLSTEYHRIYDSISKHLSTYGELPSFDDLVLSTRDEKLKNSIFALKEAEEVDIENSQLLDYLKNEFVQIEIMDELGLYLENSIAMGTAEENLEALHDIIVRVEDKVELDNSEESMRTIDLFEDEEALDKRLKLGLNTEFDNVIQFGSGDLILFGGPRGSGKSIICANACANAYAGGDSAMYFTVEMNTRSTLRRIAAISTGIPATAIKNRNLSVSEWRTLAEWWCQRFEDGENIYQSYLQHNDFNKLHNELIKNPLREKQIDIVYSAELTLNKIRLELDRKVEKLKPKVVVIDYLNVVKRFSTSMTKNSQYDWQEQIEVSKALKSFAQIYEIPIIAPYQVDKTGEARFAKGVLDSPDASFVLNTYKKEDCIMAFTCTKMREETDEISFASRMNWASLKIGPESMELPGTGDEPVEDMA